MVEAGPSPVGVVLASVSVVLMSVLSIVERRTGRELGSIGVFAVREGIEARNGDTWATPVGELVEDRTDEHDDDRC